MTDSFLWYDLETWGINPRDSQIAQFAGVRTDTELQQIGDPHVIWVKPFEDLLPSPTACLVTGLDPFEVSRRGLREAAAINEIHELVKAAGTCTVGWNTLRFDDEFIRYGLYRNFHDPYAREWQYGNSRWDLLDVARLFHALRPDGLNWPKREDGAPSFRLEHLAAANSVDHGHAHEALSDVEATIGLARIMRRAQPKLWNYALRLRDKRFISGMISLAPATPLLNISHRFPAERACAGIVLPLAWHPRNRNQLITAELHVDPESWLDLDVETLAERLYSKSADLAPETVRPPLKGVHINKCPALVALNHVQPNEWERMGVDLAICLRNADRFTPAVLNDLQAKLSDLFKRDSFESDGDVDGALYDELPNRSDDHLRARIRESLPEDLAELRASFRDPRGEPLLLRYRARNWPETLSAKESSEWAREVLDRWNGKDPNTSVSKLDAFRQELDECRRSESKFWESELAETQLALLNSVESWQQQAQALWLSRLEGSQR